jgi:hypothetical protein
LRLALYIYHVWSQPRAAVNRCILVRFFLHGRAISERCRPWREKNVFEKKVKKKVEKSAKKKSQPRHRKSRKRELREATVEHMGARRREKRQIRIMRSLIGWRSDRRYEQSCHIKKRRCKNVDGAKQGRATFVELSQMDRDPGRDDNGGSKTGPKWQKIPDKRLDLLV